VAVVQNEYNGQTYANIGLIRPDKSAEPLQALGQIRAPEGAPNRTTGTSARPAADDASGGEDWRRVRVHVGKHKGLDLGDLDREAVEALAAKWLPQALEMDKPLKADRELIAALRKAGEALADGRGTDGGDEPF
jgi:hypothetical protein